MDSVEFGLKPNELAFIALTGEYCQVAERAGEETRSELAGRMLKLLPRIYICATDLLGGNSTMPEGSLCALPPSLAEEDYDHVRATIAQVMAEEDVYLEVFVNDMRYSDTPIAASISENLADLYQEFYNLIHTVADAPSLVQIEMIAACGIDFKQYWGQTLCNVLRALHSVVTDTETDY